MVRAYPTVSVNKQRRPEGCGQFRSLCDRNGGTLTEFEKADLHIKRCPILAASRGMHGIWTITSFRNSI